MGPMNDSKENYKKNNNLHYVEVRGDVLRPTRGTYTSSSEVKLKSKRLSLEIKNILHIDNRLY